MNLEAVAAYLAANGCGTVGSTIFVTEMPAETAEGILLMGSYGGTPIDWHLPNYYKTDFRVVVRSASYESGKALAGKALDVLTKPGGFVSGTLEAKQSLPENLPRPYRRSVAGYWEFEVDVAIVFYEENA